MPSTQKRVQNVTDYYRDRFADPRYNNGGFLRAERRGRNVLALEKLDRWIESIDGTRSKHYLHHYELTGPNVELCEVSYHEKIVTTSSEFDLSESLFNQYRLFP